MLHTPRDEAPWSKSGSPKPSRGIKSPYQGLIGKDYGRDFAVSETTPLRVSERGMMFQRSGSNLDEDDDDDDDEDEHKTSVGQTYIHLVKGYLGAGCLSLPWAVSQLGIVGGTLSIMGMSYWSSYNCWTVVKLKRYIERTTTYLDDKASEASSVATTNTNITYPDVGDWAYGTSFQTYTTACICTQQLAICTVFFSFVGENLLALFDQLNVTGFLGTHLGVMTLVFPFILSISFVPSLKGLTPFMAAGTALLFVAFFAIGVIIFAKFEERPAETPTVYPPLVPLSLCAILYSYEGICLILPVESSMAKPKHFKKVFVLSMGTVAAILAFFASICVLTFGDVTNGSMTAFLLDAYHNDPKIQFWLMVANTAVSLSVLMTYPLQLFPALELIAPWVMRTFGVGGNGEKDDMDDDDLSAFEPLPPLPEHGVAEIDEIPPMEHDYDKTDDDDGNAASSDGLGDQDTASVGAGTAISTMMPVMVMPGDSPQLRVALVFTTYLIAVVVPNVQALISLAGALAGSSTALLLPPLLELAWIRHLEHDAPDATTVLLEQAKANTSNTFTLATAPQSQEDAGSRDALSARETEQPAAAAAKESTNSRFSPANWLGKWWVDKVKCYILLFFGFIFFGIGTYASLADIVRAYTA